MCMEVGRDLSWQRVRDISLKAVSDMLNPFKWIRRPEVLRGIIYNSVAFIFKYSYGIAKPNDDLRMEWFSENERFRCLFLSLIYLQSNKVGIFGKPPPSVSNQALFFKGFKNQPCF